MLGVDRHPDRALERPDYIDRRRVAVRLHERPRSGTAFSRGLAREVGDEPA